MAVVGSHTSFTNTFGLCCCSQILHLSQHKFASNVVEKCVVYGSQDDRELIVNEVCDHIEKCVWLH